MWKIGRHATIKFSLIQAHLISLSTLEAMKETENGHGTRYKNINALFKDLDREGTALSK